ncbi:hypothetical protein [Desulfoluna spongiiphila]|uniref:Uncharacterized protein n=1 Tax=Desulfoluna spongiiphila TaxID=419481 RepID=A0A1G5DW58_9BACT|nr:hypothetical protein [Desulfoluna spongiiphila]SCY18720.1 hypothetical protein SAMN05216233_10520 [Desulfoluna spongiiphila]
MANALERGVPIIIESPTAQLLTELTGCGAEKVEAALIVQGKGRFFYSVSYMDPSATSKECGVVQTEIPEDQRGNGEEEAIQQESPLPTATTTEITDDRLETRLVEDLGDMESVNRKLETLQNDPFQQSDIPDNRKWSHIWESDWINNVKNDPSEEQQNKTQKLRFRYSTTFKLLAADEPAKVKILNTVVGGFGFDPVPGGEQMIRNDHKHRGWAQSVTAVEFNPVDDALGFIQDYVPINQANSVTISAGYSWDIGFTGGGGPEGPEGSLSFSYGQNASHTKESKDFRTLTESRGDNGIIFYHNANIVGGDTEINALNLFDEEYWNSDMAKFFYFNFPNGERVRGWPSLSTQLLKPDSECVWYAKADETRTAVIDYYGHQGINYFYTKSYNNTNHFDKSIRHARISLTMDTVHYNDPES